MARSVEQKPWERRQRETAKAFRAFVCFRDLGPERSIAQAARLVDRHVSLLRRWAAKHAWWSRVHAFDLETDRHEQATRVRERAESLRQRMSYSRQLQKLGMAGLSKLVGRDSVTGETQLIGELKPRDAAALLKLGADLEDRLAPPSQEQAAPGDSLAGLLNQKPDEELQRLLELIEGETIQPKEDEDDVTE